MTRRSRELRKLAFWWYQSGGFSIEDNDTIHNNNSSWPCLGLPVSAQGPLDYSCRTASLTSPHPTGLLALY